MRIGELARATKLTTSRIRFYEEQGLIPAAKRLRNGYRDYPDSTTSTLNMIRQAQSFGFSLAEIRRAMRTKVPRARQQDHFLGLLYEKLEQVDRHLAQMKQARTRLRAKIAVLEAGGAVPL